MQLAPACSGHERAASRAWAGYEALGISSQRYDRGGYKCLVPARLAPSPAGALRQAREWVHQHEHAEGQGVHDCATEVLHVLGSIVFKMR